MELEIGNSNKSSSDKCFGKKFHNSLIILHSEANAIKTFHGHNI